MKTDFSKIYSKDFWGSYARGIFNAFGSAPRNYWSWFLAAFSFLFLAALLLNLYLFLSLIRGREESFVGIADSSGPRIDLSGLTSAVKVIKENETEFQKVFDLPLRGDPSL
ncbi:MAG: hypothetical protein AAB527_03805 [Patescibacteria group bacterium]